MKIKKIHVTNFKSLANVLIIPNDVLALVGRNNSGKSNVLGAIKLFFDGSTKSLSKDCFYNHDTDNPIEITLTFSHLSDWEKDQFNPWMNGDLLIVKKKFVYSGEDKIDLYTIALVNRPSIDWLNSDIISGSRITEWWNHRVELIINGVNFAEYLGNSKPGVGAWNQYAAQFIDDHIDIIPFEVVEVENPNGYPGVLKGALPEFIYVPAVRDVLEETKVLKTNPFGQLINSVFEKIPDEQKTSISEKFNEIENLLNRGNENRIAAVQQIESRLNTLICDLIDCDVEIEVGVPKLKEVFGSTTIYANDGIRTRIETKGHGLQRSMIFCILRAYAEFANTQKAGDAADQRSTIFAIEEPELYLHPQFQRTLMSVFRTIAGGTDQVLYSTQSSIFIDIQFFDEICLMRREDIDGEIKSQPTQLSIKDFLDDLKARTGHDGSENGIRELYSHVFNPLINEGFFADKVVIVEGDSELYSLPIYSYLLSYDLDRNNVSIVHSNGKGPIDRLLRVFNGFKIPAYIWFDGDKSSDDESMKDKTMELLNLCGFELFDIANLKTTVGHNFAVLEEDYEQILRDQIPNYEALLNNAGDALGPTGKPLKHRFIALSLKKSIENGGDPFTTIPQVIIDIVTGIQQCTYSERILKSLDQ